LLQKYLCESEEKYFLVPSLLKDKDTEEANGLECVFDFSDNFLPIGVFERLICLCVAHAHWQKRNNNLQLEKPKLYQNSASIEFEPGFTVYLREKPKLQQICMYLHNHSNASRSFRIIYSMILKLNYDVMGTGLSWNTKLEDPSTGKLVELEVARGKRLVPWYEKSDAEIMKPVPAENVDMDAFLQGL